MTIRRPFIALPLFLTVIIAAALSLGSCSSSRQTGKTLPPTDRETPDDARQKARQLADAAAAEKWQTLTMPVSVKVKDSSLPKVSGTMTMVRDKRIRISMRFLGMEVGALDVTGDSVFGYVKLNRIYVAESIPDLLGGFPAGVGNVQSMLLGRLFTLGSDNPDIKSARIAAGTDGGYTITPSKAGGKLDYNFEVSLPGNIVKALTLSYKTHQAVVPYSDFSSTATGTDRPADIDINAMVKGRGLGAEITLNYNRLVIDDSADLKPFVIPQGYRRVAASSLLKSLSGL